MKDKATISRLNHKDVGLGYASVGFEYLCLYNSSSRLQGMSLKGKVLLIRRSLQQTGCVIGLWQFGFVTE
jgi:hypothetical protein